MHLLGAFIIRDYNIEKSYRFHLFLRILDILFQITIFYFISKLISKPEYFKFVFIGLMFSRFFQFWLDIFAQNIRQEQYWGTSEQIFLSGYSSFWILLSSVIGKFIFLLIELVFFVILGILIFKVSFPFFILKILPVLIINCFSFMGLGLISGSFIMLFKRGDPVNWLVSSSFDLLSGVYFPVAILPVWLKFISDILPTTSALNIWRSIILNNSFPSLEQILVLFIWAVSLFFAGFISFKIAFNKTRQKGELGTY